jgi:hypothetical protein
MHRSARSVSRTLREDLPAEPLDEPRDLVGDRFHLGEQAMSGSRVRDEAGVAQLPDRLAEQREPGQARAGQWAVRSAARSGRPGGCSG